MPNRPLTLVVATVLVLVASHSKGVAPAHGELEVSITATANPVEGSPGAGCVATVKAEAPRQQWWVAFAQAKPHLKKGWEAVGGHVTCGAGSFGEGSLLSEAPASAPYLVVRVSTIAGLLPAMLTPERVLLLDISLSLEKLSGFGTHGEPLYRMSEENRKFYFLDRGEAFFPLLVANETEKEAFGAREVFIKFAARRAENEADAVYGVVSVTSGMEGALLLDRGAVGEVSAGKETILRNVPVGLREMGVRDASGRELTEVVRVEAGRKVLVDLSPLERSRSAASYRLVSIGKNAQGYEEYRREIDGAVVVKIPAGEFLMGNKDTEGSPLEHRVYVSVFLMDKMGVTWGQYKQFAEATGTPLPPRDPYWGIHDDHPVVYVTWEEAKTYCEWTGGRLPTEAEREKAARGTDGRKYPWGNEEPDPQKAVFRRHWGYEATAPVGTHPAGTSPYGLLDMGGNVWEWCSDWYDRDYYEVSPYRDPKGPPSGVAHVLRGGSWDSRPSVLSASCRNWGHRGYREGDFGFRCAMDAPR